MVSEMIIQSVTLDQVCTDVFSTMCIGENAFMAVGDWDKYSAHRLLCVATFDRQKNSSHYVPIWGANAIKLKPFWRVDV